MKIPFNKPFLTGKEAHYIYQAVSSGKISGNGIFTKKCHQFFKDRYNFKTCLLTTSCTDALEMAALLANIQPGDEVIMPSYTFVSTANPFVLRGAKIIFADSYSNNPNIDPVSVASLVTKKTKAIVVVHYAGIACDMDAILEIAKAYNLIVIEDAAQAINSYYKGIPLGGIGDLSAFSFHETKNVISGEGGLLVVNNNEYAKRAEIIWEKGTNRAAFFRGEVDKYGWVDVGSSFLPSEVISGFLFAQLENLDAIQTKRTQLWETYFRILKPLGIDKNILLPHIPDFATNNAHLFYLVCGSMEERTALINHLKEKGVHAVFHYLSLHKSTFYRKKYKGEELLNCDKFSDCLVRLPMFYDLTVENVIMISELIIDFYKKRKRNDSAPASKRREIY